MEEKRKQEQQATARRQERLDELKKKA